MCVGGGTPYALYAYCVGGCRYDGPSAELFDETFRTWSAASVGFSSDVILFGPQFASAKPRLLNHSIGLITSAVRRADACGASSHGGQLQGVGSTARTTTLIFRSPAFNIDPVNSFRQQRTFARRVRPMVETAGVTFLDIYPATRHAVLQHTPQAVRFDHFSSFHFHDAGRYARDPSFEPLSNHPRVARPRLMVVLVCARPRRVSPRPASRAREIFFVRFELPT